MAIPEPFPGLVIRYAYLWRSEAERGREEGIKDRPCAVVLAVKRESTMVVVAPVTHAPPENPGVAIEIPAATKIRLRLDDARSWIVTNDLNFFVWPGPDLRLIDSREPQSGFAYGYLPEKITRQLIESVRAQWRDSRTWPVKRT